MNRFLSSIGLRGRKSDIGGQIKSIKEKEPSSTNPTQPIQKKDDNTTSSDATDSSPNSSFDNKIESGDTINSNSVDASPAAAVSRHVKEEGSSNPPVSFSVSKDLSEKSVLDDRSHETSVQGFTLSATPSRLANSNKNSRNNSKVNSPNISPKHSRQSSKEIENSNYNENSVSAIESVNDIHDFHQEKEPDKQREREEAKTVDTTENELSEEELEDEQKNTIQEKKRFIEPATQKKRLTPLKPLTFNKTPTVDKSNANEEKVESYVEELEITEAKEEKSDVAPVCSLCEDAVGVWKCEECNAIYCEENECDQQIHKPMSKVKHKRTRINEAKKAEKRDFEKQKREEQLKLLKQKQLKKAEKAEAQFQERREEEEKQQDKGKKQVRNDNYSKDISIHQEEEEVMDDDVIESNQGKPLKPLYGESNVNSPSFPPLNQPPRLSSAAPSLLSPSGNNARRNDSLFPPTLYNESTSKLNQPRPSSAHSGMQHFEQNHLHPRQPSQLYHPNSPQPVSQSHPNGLAYNLPDAVGITPLTKDEEAELTAKFHEYDLNHDGAIDKNEISRFLAELEFTYHDDYIASIMKFIFAQSQTVNSQVLGLADFLYFMLIFYALHDSVVTLIDSLFSRLFDRAADDALISVLCPFVKISPNGELDLNDMQDKLMAAVELERVNQEKEGKQEEISREEFRRREEEWKEQEKREMKQREEMEQREREKQQAAEILHSESERIRLSRSQEVKLPESMPPQQSQILSQPPFHSPSLIRSNSTPAIKSSLSMRSAGSSQGKTVEFSPSPDASSSPASPPILDHSVVANRLALSLSTADDEYLKRSWVVLIGHFDMNNTGGLPISTLVNSFHAMGLVLTTAHLTHFLSTSNVDARGILDFSAFCSLYSQLLYGWIEGEMDLQYIKERFAAFDLDGDGMISRAEFSYVINGTDKIWSKAEMADLVSLMDEDGDGLVSYVEYVYLLSQAYANNSNRKSRSGRAGHEALLSSSSLTSLCAHLHRSSHPLPLHYCLTYRLMPSTFIPSLLARMATHKQVQASQRVRPNLDATGLRYEDFDCDNQAVVLPKALVAAYREKTMNNASALPAANVRASMNLSLNSSLTGGLSSTTPTPHPELHPLTATATYLFTLHKSIGVPSPPPPHQSLIISRHVRVALLHPHTHALLSNVLTARADIDPDVEDEWKFEQATTNGGAAEILSPVRWNEFVIRTSIENALLYIEHTCKVYQQHSNPSIQDSKDNVRPNDSDSLEFSCGYTTLTLQLHTTQPKPQRQNRPILGGTLQCQQSIRESDVRKRTGWRNMISGSNKLESQLNLTLAPANGLASNSSLRRSLSHLPLHYLTPTSHTRTLEPYLTLLSRVVPLSFPISSQRIQQQQQQQRLSALDPTVSIYEKLVDDPALKEVFTQRWSKEYSLMTNKEKKMSKEGGLNPLVITRYRSILLSMQLPLVTLPSPIGSDVGVKDLHRMVGAMTLLMKDPIDLLMRDKNYAWEVSQNKTKSTAGSNGERNAAQNFYQPFSTGAIAYALC